MTRLFFKPRYYPNLKEDRFLIIFYFPRMKLEKIFSCTHSLVSPAQLPPGRCNLLLFSVSLVCALLTSTVSPGFAPWQWVGGEGLPAAAALLPR